MAILAVFKDDLVVVHLPRQLSLRLSQILLARNSIIDCIITSVRKYTIRRYTTKRTYNAKTNYVIFSGKRKEINIFFPIKLHTSVTNK